MKVRRTGGKRGSSPTWYIWADDAREQAAIRAGLVAEMAPDARFRFVLAWGFGSEAEATAAMERMREELDLPELAREEGWPERIVKRVIEDDARLKVHQRELATLEGQLGVLARELGDARLFALAREFAGWRETQETLRLEMVDTVELACLLCGMSQ